MTPLIDVMLCYINIIHYYESVCLLMTYLSLRITLIYKYLDIHQVVIRSDRVIAISLISCQQTSQQKSYVIVQFIDNTVNRLPHLSQCRHTFYCHTFNSHFVSTTLEYCISFTHRLTLMHQIKFLEQHQCARCRTFTYRIFTFHEAFQVNRALS